jgi:hypothetical protein
MVRLTGALAILLSAGIGGWMARSRERAELDAMLLAALPGELSFLYSYRDRDEVHLQDGEGMRLERRLLMASGGLSKMDSFMDSCTLRVPPHVSEAAPTANRLTIRQSALGPPFKRLGLRHTTFHFTGNGESAEAALRPAWLFWGACALVAASPLCLWGLGALLILALTPVRPAALQDARVTRFRPASLDR